MKKLLLALVALAFMPAAWACDTYTSAEKAPGARVLVIGDDDLLLREGGKEVEYIKTSAGTGTDTTIAVIPDAPDSAVETKAEAGVFWLGPEKFVEYCN